jgi:hypothetical protein
MGNRQVQLSSRTQNRVFKEDPCNDHRVKRNMPNEVHAFSIYRLLSLFQRATERNP